ncbi:MAG: Spy/CpxP family protein refolding chaperone [Flammeovirgaceae bacterium]
MSRERLLTIAVIFLLLLNTGIVAFLIFMPKLGPPHRPELFELIERRLQLSNEQKKQFYQLRNEHRASINTLNDKFQEVFSQYMQLLEQKDIDSLQQALFESQLATLSKTKAVVTLRHFEKVKQLCDAEQQQKFDELIPEITHFIMQEPRRGKR